MRLRSLTLLGAVVGLLAGCGGGSDSSDEPTVGLLDKYVGTYSYCEGHERVTLSITSAGVNALSFAERSDYYQEDNCTGAVVGTETMSAQVTATYVSTGSAQVTGYPATSSIATYTVDRVSMSIPAFTISLTGSGLTTINGQPCIVYSGGQSCITSGLTYPAAAATGGLTLTSTALLTFIATATGYALDTAYPR